jgi:hypothetical protein
MFRMLIKKAIKNRAKIQHVLRVVAYALVVAVEAVKSVARYMGRGRQAQVAA